MLVQVEPNTVLDACTKYTAKVGAGKTKVFDVPSRTIAIQNRDTMARMVYDRLFMWIVAQASETLFQGANENNDVFIGVLDIFGFEFYENHHILPNNMQIVNGLDQLNINICNEILQQQFVKVSIGFLLDSAVSYACALTSLTDSCSAGHFRPRNGWLCSSKRGFQLYRLCG